MRELLPMLLVLFLACGICFLAGHQIGSHDPISFLVGAGPGRSIHHPPLVGNSQSIRRIRIVEGHVFDLVLTNGDRYLVQLDGIRGTPAEAKDKVLRLLNQHLQHGHSPTVVLGQWNASTGRWSATLYYDGRNSLADWLSSQNLVYR